MEDLPPTSHSVSVHIERAYFVIHKMVFLLRSLESLDERQFGFEIDDELFVPNKVSNPIPEELAIYCTYLTCVTGRCLCRYSTCIGNNYSTLIYIVR